MNTALLNQYNVKFTKVISFGEIEHRCFGGGLAQYLNDMGESIRRIDETLEKVDYFINGIQGPPLEIQEMESQGFDYYSALFDYESVDIHESGFVESIQTLPLQDFKEILLMWKDYVQN